MSFTIRDFHEKYPADEVCLEMVLKQRHHDFTCPKCFKNKLYKIKNRPAYACSCGYQVRPLSGTPMERTKIPLTSWFYVMYMMTQTKSGVSAMNIQRHLGVSYKTAWRMMMKVRKMMADDSPLKGDIEVDETYFRAKPWRTVRPLAYNGRAQTVFGMVERGGRAKAICVPTRGGRTLLKEVDRYIPKGSTIYTDGYQAYQALSKDYIHYSVNHGRGEYVDGHKYTNNIENVFSHMKRGIYGVYRSVRPEYLQRYLDEYTFRYSNRFCPDMFQALLCKL